MLIGMTYDEFWNSSIDRWKIYDRYYALRTEKENEISWLSGAYVFEGICAALSNAFNKGGQKTNYPDKPHRITPLTDIEKQAKERKEREQLREYFDSLTRSINERAEKRKKEKTRVDNNGN